MAQESQFFAGLLATLENFAESFERVAANGAQEELAEQFRQFVTGLPGLMMAAARQEAALAGVLFGQDHLPSPDGYGKAGCRPRQRDGAAGRER